MMFDGEQGPGGRTRSLRRQRQMCKRERTGTGKAGSSSSITRAAGFDSAGIEMRGRYVHNTSPAVTGKGQILTYDNTTKVAGLTTVDGTAFAAATPYMIEAMRWEVKKRTSYHMNAWEQSYELTRVLIPISRCRRLEQRQIRVPHDPCTNQPSHPHKLRPQ